MNFSTDIKIINKGVLYLAASKQPKTAKNSQKQPKTAKD